MLTSVEEAIVYRKLQVALEATFSGFELHHLPTVAESFDEMILKHVGMAVQQNISSLISGAKAVSHNQGQFLVGNRRFAIIVDQDPRSLETIVVSFLELEEGHQTRRPKMRQKSLRFTSTGLIRRIVSFHTQTLSFDRNYLLRFIQHIYLSLVVGSSLKPRADAVASLWGYGNLTGDWYRKPSKYWLTFPVVAKEAAQNNAGVDLYIYTRQTGTWVETVTGLAFDKGAEAIRALCPLFNVSNEFPSTFLLAGTADEDVPYGESVRMSDAIARGGGKCEFVTIPGGGHGWEETSGSAKESAIGKILQFLKQVDRDTALNE